MATFDSWEAAIHPPEDYLMHFRTKGSKNGVRRYQNEDGTWTELGLEERRAREGWGESNKTRKLKRKVDKAERKQERKAARAERKAIRAEIKRKKSIKGLTDEEMKAKLERAKMEAEYRELTKRNRLIESGANLVTKYLEYRNTREQNALEANKQKLEMERLRTQRVQAVEGTKKSKNEARKAKEDRKTKQADVRGGLKTQRKTEYKRAKIGWRNGTIRGGIQQRIHDTLVARGEGKAERIKERSFTTGILRNRKRIDKYNGKLDPWQEKQSYDPDPWNRKKNNTKSQSQGESKKKNKN